MTFTHSLGEQISSSTLYRCPCGAAEVSTSYHTLPSLYFCEECDSIRCEDCVTEEVSAYYCPNCLYEVPTASVRAEKNRCLRNCFQCPSCTCTLAVVPTDPTDPSTRSQPASQQASIGEPPYYLSCLACKWDSKSVGITFEKPTHLAAQMQKLEESTIAIVEYDNIREHLETWLKSNLEAEQASLRLREKAGSHSHHHSSGAIAAAARALHTSKSAIRRDIPSSIASASRFNSLHNLAAVHRRTTNLRTSGLGGNSKAELASQAATKDELQPYHPKSKAVRQDEQYQLELERARSVQKAKNPEDFTLSDQRWSASYSQPIKVRDLRPQRTMLKTKRTKRCHACRHIVIKPDSKASSTRFKIRLVASNYLPRIDVHRRIPPSLGSRLSAAGASASSAASASRRARVSTSGGFAGNTASAVETLIQVGSQQDVNEPLRPGRNFSFQLTFVNPLYDAIEVLVELLEPADEEDEDELEKSEKAEAGYQATADASTVSATTVKGPAPIKRHWAVSMPGTKFDIGAFAEAWEYEDEDEDDAQHAESGGLGSKKRYAPGILAKRANKTVVQLDLQVGREATGEVRVPLFITYAYTAEDPILPSSKSGTPMKGAAKDDKKGKDDEGALNAPPQEPNLKTFSFWASVPLGKVVPRNMGTGGSTLEREARRMPSSSQLKS